MTVNGIAIVKPYFFAIYFFKACRISVKSVYIYFNIR